MIEGASTLLSPDVAEPFLGPEQIWISGDELLVTVPRGNRVLGFPLTAGGPVGDPAADAAPTRHLSGTSTGFTGVFGAQPRALTVSNGELFVARPPFRIAVFDLATATGDVEPVRTIEGPFNGPTGIANPGGLWIEGGELYVTSEENSSVRVFGASESGQPIPQRVFEGAVTELDHPVGVLVVP